MIADIENILKSIILSLANTILNMFHNDHES
jgi:hypothetical protein